MVPRPPRARDAPREHGALVVGDPRGDLPRARAEARSVARALGVEPVLGGAARREAVIAGLATTGLFHYAGHGTFGGDAWGGELLLADDGTLRTGDVLALPGVPPRVVLSGCDTARSPATRVENLGLAQAFVVAGSRVVVAAARPVSDADAARFSTALHAAPPDDLVAAFRAATLALRDAGSPDWSAFRVYVP